MPQVDLDMTTLIRWDHLDHLAEIHGIAVKDIWAEMQVHGILRGPPYLSCTTAQFKERATKAAAAVAKRAKEKANGVGS